MMWPDFVFVPLRRKVSNFPLGVSDSGSDGSERGPDSDEVTATVPQLRDSELHLIQRAPSLNHIQTSGCQLASSGAL
eukprot:604817-Pelagomonas_calceolata.AAC.1